jgi:cbb3-type cytochrome oxidase subunit 3
MSASTAEVLATYEGWRAFAAHWGLIFFGFIFLCVVVYAYWPSRQQQFEQDARIIFREDDDDV